MSGYSSYNFVTEWTVQGTLGEVSSILKDVEGFPRWWRPVDISATVLDAGDQQAWGG
jgi:hypothetical protein